MVHNSSKSGTIGITVGGVDLNVLVDSGATTNIISEGTLEMLKAKKSSATPTPTLVARNFMHMPQISHYQ